MALVQIDANGRQKLHYNHFVKNFECISEFLTKWKRRPHLLNQFCFGVGYRHITPVLATLSTTSTWNSTLLFFSPYYNIYPLSITVKKVSISQLMTNVTLWHLFIKKKDIEATLNHIYSFFLIEEHSLTVRVSTSKGEGPFSNTKISEKHLSKIS